MATLPYWQNVYQPTTSHKMSQITLKPIRIAWNLHSIPTLHCRYIPTAYSRKSIPSNTWKNVDTKKPTNCQIINWAPRKSLDFHAHTSTDTNMIEKKEKKGTNKAKDGASSELINQQPKKTKKKRVKATCPPPPGQTSTPPSLSHKQ